MLTAAIAVSACTGLRERVDRAQLDRQDDEYVRVALALGVRDPDSLDFYAGPAAWLQAARVEMPSLATIRGRASALAADLARARSTAQGIAARRRFLRAQIAAIVARIDLLAGARWRFDEESRRLFDVDAGGIGAGATDASALAAKALPGSGSSAERIAALERRYLVPPARLPAVVDRAVDECRRVTRAHLDLPADEAVRIEFVRGAKWPAFTRYEGRSRSRTEIDADVGFTIDRVLEMACHETYPGHHTINLQLDARVQPLYSPQSLRTEGAASYAWELAFPFERRLAFERDVLAPIAGIDPAGLREYLQLAVAINRLRGFQADIARRYLDGVLDFARAARALEDEALMTSDAAAATLKFFNEFRTYVVAYTVGYNLVRDRIEAEPDESARWRAYRRWIGT